MFALYVYYQVSDANAPALLAQVRAMQAALARAEGVATDLKKRPDSAHGLQTWMEIYTGAGPRFADQLDDAVRAAAIGRLIDGRRHTEVFTEMSPCA